MKLNQQIRIQIMGRKIIKMAMETITTFQTIMVHLLQIIIKIVTKMPIKTIKLSGIKKEVKDRINLALTSFLLNI